jgi:polysaccharide biosynthesis/export protein
MALLLSLPVGISLGNLAPAQAQLGSEQAVPAAPPMPGTPAPADGSSSNAAPAVPILDDAYTLGAGDRIHLDFFNIPEYTGETQVLADGSLNLPLVGNISVQGQTLNGAADTIEAAYQQLLRNPIVTISLLRPRPLRVSIAGEVNRPGSYAMSLRAEDGEATEFQWPTVTQVIQTAGGITQQADVSQIQIQRADKPGEAERITVNLWDLLKEADLSQDRPLRDGDSIVIPTATSIQAAEATQLSSASFAPDTIRVSIVGEVVAPGVVEVPPNTPLNQALLAAGGFDRSRARTSQVELIRLNPDGTATQQSIPIDFAQGISDSSNPILRNNDVVVVGRSDSAQFSDSVNGILETIGRIFPFFSLF